MRIYLAGTSVSDPKKEPVIQQLFQQGCKLHSYYHCVDGFEKKWYKMNKKNKVNLFLDSGAFSAYIQNTEVSLEEYIAFIKANEDALTVYANLDVIGSDIETWKNQLRMEKAGLHPLPVYHLEDDISYLHKYIEKYDYICLGGMARGFTTDQRIAFLDRCFEVICDTPDRMPKVKVHGFGVTALRALLRYPWYSVDSTSWVVAGRIGNIYMPYLRGGKWVYDENSWAVCVSNRSNNLKDAGKHLQTMTKLEQAQVMQYLDERGYVIGESDFRMEPQSYILQENERWAQKKPTTKDALRKVEHIRIPGISNTYQLRDELNIMYFLDLEKSVQPWPWPWHAPKMKGFFV